MKRALLLVVGLLLALPAGADRFPPDSGTGAMKEFQIVLSSAQILALDTVPVAAILAESSYCAPLPWAWSAYKPAGTAYAGIAAGDDIVLETTGGTGYVTFETTGFLDQATAQRRAARLGAGSITDALFGLNLQFRLIGPITTGDTPLYITITYWDACSYS